MYLFQIMYTAWRIVLQLLWKVAWAYGTPPRLGKYSKLLMFKISTIKTLQHGHRFDGIIMLYAIINVHKWLSCCKLYARCFINKLWYFSCLYFFLSNTRFKYYPLKRLMHHPMNWTVIPLYCDIAEYFLFVFFIGIYDVKYFYYKCYT